MVQTSDLSYQYPAIKQMEFPDLQVEAGHGLLIHGESGCGKTTLLHLLAGLRKPTTGSVSIGGEQVSELSSPKLDQYRGHHIGIIHQRPYFIESLSILDNLLLSPYSAGKNKAIAVANRLNIRDVLNRYPNQLSMGQKQRATIARSVMNGPRVILADEPTSALDNKNCSYVIDLLLEEAVVNDAALIIVSHDDRLRSEIANQIDLSTTIN